MHKGEYWKSGHMGPSQHYGQTPRLPEGGRGPMVSPPLRLL